MILTLDRIIRQVLSQANAQQNMHYPPHIADTHINIVTPWFIDACADLFPTKPRIIEMVKPWMTVKTVRVKDGLIIPPAGYRQLLGLAIFVSPNGDVAAKKTDTFDPLEPNEKSVQAERVKVAAKKKPVKIKTQDEWYDLIGHSYKQPTLEDPIACVFEGEGIRIYPTEAPMVEISYLREPKTYKYGYKMNSDDTYVWDPATTIESEWTTNAAPQIFKAMTTLYSTWVRDIELKEGVELMKAQGLF